MKGLYAVVRRSSTALFTWITGAGMILIVLTIFVQIFFRYVLNDPLVWSEELAKFLFPWLVLAGAALGAKSNTHIKIDFFVDLLPARVQAVFDTVARIASFVFCVVVIVATIPLAASQWGQKSTALGIPTNYYTLSLTVGLLGIALYLLSGARGKDTEAAER